jgi:hypothetical protein
MGGTAEPGADYTISNNSGQLTIPAGEGSATVVLHAIADQTKEKKETAAMTLIKGTGYKLPRRPKAVVTIVDGP